MKRNVITDCLWLFTAAAAVLCATVVTNPAAIAQTAGAPGAGEDQEAELAKQLSNPVSSLISVPFQANEDFNIGPAGGNRFLLNIQPVIPISISKDWNLILRTILPVISQNDVFGHSGSQSGLGNTTQSFFL